MSCFANPRAMAFVNSNRFPGIQSAREPSCLCSITYPIFRSSALLCLALSRLNLLESILMVVGAARFTPAKNAPKGVR